MIVKLYNENPMERVVRDVAKRLAAGAVIIYPTDTLYALGCSIKSVHGIEKLKQIKGKDSDQMSLVCADLTSIATYAKVDDVTFRTLRKNLPGAFTFIMPASNKAPEKVLEGRRTVGIRVPDNNIALAIIRELGAPLVTTSVRHAGAEDETEYLTDPSLIAEAYPMVDLVVDGGIGMDNPSTVVDCSIEGAEPTIIRQANAILK
ncbi:MAG: L-threonylcarbamoyladenylate synthase [Mucinivorans sp.]